MEITGEVINGTIVPDQKIDWPDRSRVVIALKQSSLDPEHSDDGDALGPSLAEVLGDVIGSLDLPEDFARNHDHYCHGAKKRFP